VEIGWRSQRTGSFRDLSSLDAVENGDRRPQPTRPNVSYPSKVVALATAKRSCRGSASVHVEGHLVVPPSTSPPRQDERQWVC
jgi:hypothetical protein